VNLTRGTFYRPRPVERAVEYYSERLDTLADYANRLRGHREWLALTYEDIVHDTPITMKRLETFLGLKSNLGEEYRMQAFTGKRGDPSATIRAGRIIRDRASYIIDTHVGDLRRALRAYENCVRALAID
jgi:hypothetical protein